MQTLVIDTYKVIKRLQERGFSKDQAEALVSVAQEIDLSAFVTKADLRDALLSGNTHLQIHVRGDVRSGRTHCRFDPVAQMTTKSDLTTRSTRPQKKARATRRGAGLPSPSSSGGDN
jgi:hypothetical protein